MSIEYYGDESAPSAIVIRKDYESEGIEFFSPLDYPQQLGYMKRPAGYEVVPHRHNQIERTITDTQEVLLIRTGHCQVTLFDDRNIPAETINLSDGDIIFLAKGGHGIRMNTECQIIEIKQGPYLSNMDKTALESELN
jgi:hypothetical protein